MRPPLGPSYFCQRSVNGDLSSLSGPGLNGEGSDDTLIDNYSTTTAISIPGGPVDHDEADAKDRECKGLEI